MLGFPLHFAPYLKPVIWGGSRIAPFKRLSAGAEGIGESWELSAVPGHVSVVDRGPLAGKTLTELIALHGADLMGRANYERYGTSFPLLVKIIDARADLSVQVHPDDALAQRRHGCAGKTEMWHIIETEPGARIHVGLNAPLTPEEYERRVADNSIMDVIASYESAPGDTFFLPAGRIHAIGAGNLLAEIQQTSDITYRIYDYDRRDAEGNPRELHTELAKDAIDYTVYPSYRTTAGADGVLAQCDYFDVRRVELTDGLSRPMSHERDSFTIVMCLGGTARIKDAEGNVTEIGRGDTLLYPAVMQELVAEGDGVLLTVQA